MTALAFTIAQAVYMDRIFAAHLEAGGVDDPDAVFGHFDPLVLLAPFAIVICVLGFVVYTIGWLLRKCQRHSRMRKQLHQW